MVSSTSLDALAVAGGRAREPSRTFHIDLSPAIDSSRFSKDRVLLEHRGLLELAADAGLGDLAVRSGSSRSMVWPNQAEPLSGRVLPVMTSIIVVLPAPLGPMMQRSSPASMYRVSLFSAWKPSKLTRDVFEVQDRVVRGQRPAAVARVLSQPALRSRTPTGAAKVRRVMRSHRLRGRRLPRAQLVGQADDALRQEQRDDHEQGAQRVEPDLRHARR